MLWKLFLDKETGKEYGSYTIFGEAVGEELATKELIAYERGLDVDQIETQIVERS